MSSEITARSSGAWTTSTDSDAAYRDDVLSLLARLNLEPAQAMALVEAGTGRRFETCRPMQLVPLLQDVLDFLDSHRIPVETRRL